MKIKQTKLIYINIVFVALLGLAALLTPNATVSALCGSNDTGGACVAVAADTTTPDTTADTQKDCTDVDTSIIKIQCDPSKTGIEGSGVWALLLLAINILTAGVGLAAVAGVVYGAILYTTSNGDPAKVKQALSTFTNIAIGVIAYAAMYMVLNFITPGGLFN